jgi:hypothetical protein
MLYFLSVRAQVDRQYKYVKDQFEVVPKKDLLILEGFAPVPKGHELELVDLTAMESLPLDDREEEKKPEVEVAVKKKKPAPKASKASSKVHAVGSDEES